MATQGTLKDFHRGFLCYLARIPRRRQTKKKKKKKKEREEKEKRDFCEIPACSFAVSSLEAE